MGILEQLTSTFLKKGNLPINEIVSWVMQQGSLTSFIDKFKQNGLSNIVESWLGEGKNLPISAEQVQNVLGIDSIAQLAQKIGLDNPQTSGLLSQYLPDIIKHLSSGGQDISKIGDTLLAQGLDFLKNKLK